MNIHKIKYYTFFYNALCIHYNALKYPYNVLYGRHRKCYQNYNAMQLHYLLMVFSIHNLESKLVVCRKKKDIVRHITDCKLCVVLRKRCTKATKKMHYSQLVILFRFTKQNKQQLYITLTSSTHLPCRRRRVLSPTTATGSVNR